MSNTKKSWSELHPKKQVKKLIKQQTTQGAVFLDEEKTIQLCPGCETAIEKVKGCNHIRCKNCKLEWCWICHRLKSQGINDGGCNDKTHNSHS